MVATTAHSVRRARARSTLLMTVAACLAAIYPAAALATGTTSQKKIPHVQLPGSLHIRGTTSTPTPTPAAPTPASTAQTAGAQPGTVAPAATTPVPTSSTPGSTTPASTTPTVSVPATITPTTPPRTSTTVVVARKAGSGKTHLSTAALVLAVLGALLLLGCLVWVIARWLALEPRWTVSLMHSLREAAYRGSATWAEFSDWVRLGH